jgi:hypothetical protein
MLTFLVAAVQIVQKVRWEVLVLSFPWQHHCRREIGSGILVIANTSVGSALDTLTTSSAILLARLIPQHATTRRRG